MKIAVTGIHGQVASALRERAPRFGVEVIAVGRPGLDLSQQGTALASLAPIAADAIVHAAGYTAVDQAEDEPELARQINTDGTAEVAAAARSLNVPMLYLSTDYVFNGKKTSPYLEGDPLSPINFYGATKADGETAVVDQMSDYSILRICWLYSPFGKNFVRTVLKLAKTHKTLDIVADQQGAPTSAFDVADGILAVAKNLVSRPKDRELRGVFHMTSAGYTTWADFAETVFSYSAATGGPFATVRPIASKDFPQRAKRPANSRLDCTKLAGSHGVTLPEWRSSLRLCVERLVELDEGIGGKV